MSEPKRVINARIEVLVSELSNVEPLERQCALFELAGIGRPAIPALLNLLRSDQVHLRWQACRALAKIADPHTARELVAELADEEEDVRVPAALGLMALQRHGVDALLDALSDGDKAAIIMHDAYPVLYEHSREAWGKPLRAVMLAITGQDPMNEVPRTAAIARVELRNGGGHR